MGWGGEEARRRSEKGSGCSENWGCREIEKEWRKRARLTLLVFCNGTAATEIYTE